MTNVEHQADLARTEEHEGATDDHRVILYNDDIHGFDEVVRQVQKATGATLPDAYAVTIQAHEHGRAVCFAGPRDACERVADVLREIGLHVEIVGD
ncbi:MAG: ATP-dependent Clp protease adaptor ClpS [Nitrospiria bacterium]